MTGRSLRRIYDVALSDGREVGPTGKAPPVGNTHLRRGVVGRP